MTWFLPARGELPARHVLSAVFPEHALPDLEPPDRQQRNRHETTVEEGWFNLRRVIGLKFRLPGAGQNRARQLDDACLLYTSPSPRDQRGSRMPSSA